MTRGAVAFCWQTRAAPWQSGAHETHHRGGSCVRGVHRAAGARANGASAPMGTEGRCVRGRARPRRLTRGLHTHEQRHGASASPRMGDLLQRAAPAHAGQRKRRHRHRAGHRGTLPDGARRVIQGPRSRPERPVRVPDWSYRQRDSGAGRSLHRLRPRPCEGLRDQGLPGAALRAAGPAGPGAAGSHARGAVRAECRDPRIAGRVAAADLSHASEPPDEGRHREAVRRAGDQGCT